MAALTDAELERLRIFPLPGVALFPHGVLPLHVFEPRYRKLVEDCLAEGHPFAPWGIEPRAEETPRGPGLVRVATAGRIRVHHELEDGRYDIVVEGLERVSLVAEHDSLEPYRVVEVKRHPLQACEPASVQKHVATLKSLAGTLAMEHPRAARLLQVTLERCEDPGELSDVLCAIVHDDGRLRQHLLEMSSIPERFEHVMQTLSALLLRTHAKKGAGGEVQ